MKRLISLLLAAVLPLTLLSACRQQPAAEPGSRQQPAARAVVDAVLPFCGADQTELELEYLIPEGESGELLAAYLENAYGLETGQWEDAAVIRAAGASAFELAVLRLGDEGAAVRAASSLMSYIFARQGDFAGYAPAEADMVANGGLAQKGPWVGLFICPDPKGAEGAFEAGLGGGAPPSLPGAACSPGGGQPETDPDYPDRRLFTPPNKDDMSLYDTSAIRAAWEGGDPSGLSVYDREIYDAAREVLGEIIRDGMGGYEKETAIYDWVVNNVNYDWTHQDVMADTPRESFTPYGGLVYRKAVCLGYAAAFQLLCDLAGVECITVVGATFGSTGDHAWNMVRLDGRWYCVDATWDANQREQIGLKGQKNWDYFNVTSGHMADTDHQWDYANTPEAVDTLPAG